MCDLTGMVSHNKYVVQLVDTLEASQGVSKSLKPSTTLDSSAKFP